MRLFGILAVSFAGVGVIQALSPSDKTESGAVTLGKSLRPTPTLASAEALVTPEDNYEDYDDDEHEHEPEKDVSDADYEDSDAANGLVDANPDYEDQDSTEQEEAEKQEPPDLFTITALPAIATQPACLKSCFHPSILAPAAGAACQDETEELSNDCACAVPTVMLAALHDCAASGCAPSLRGAAAAAATSLYSAYCIGRFGEAFVELDDCGPDTAPPTLGVGSVTTLGGDLRFGLWKDLMTVEAMTTRLSKPDSGPEARATRGGETTAAISTLGPTAVAG